MSKARIELHNSGPAQPWVGQLVPIDVSVWRPEGDKPLEPFNLDDVIAPAAIVKWSAQDPPPDERQEGETRFLVQRRTLLVFAQAEGEITLPPIIARYTDPSSKLPIAVKSAALKFHAAIPAGASDPLPLVAGSVKLEQSFDRDLAGLKVGDGFTRTLTLSATDTDTISFPELTLSAVPGLTAYPGGTHAESTTERGQIAARQTYLVTYVVDRVGPHDLPGMSVRWLEPRTGRYANAIIHEQTIWTRPNWSLGFSCFGTTEAAALITAIGVTVTVALLSTLMVKRIRRGPGKIESALAHHLEEWRAFREVLHAARNGRVSNLLRSLYAWLAVRSRTSLDRTLNAFRAASPEARTLTTNIEEVLFRNSPPQIDMHDAAKVCHQARGVMRRSSDRKGRSRLNPA
ncbi:MAG TPA: hypothetical protein VER96_31835 [Polyangiaceae bacterium]|nr:hypothetical protein [Polyangiaceae bacterium]